MISVAVPGKLMLAGEYAVLKGGRALAATVELYLRVSVTTNAAGSGAEVRSELWPAPKHLIACTFEEIAREPLLAVVERGLGLYNLSGVTVDVASELTPSYGIGSSSALRLGVLMALSEVARTARPTSVHPYAPEALTALRLQREAQSKASGYDIATQLHGGLVVFTPARAGESASANDAWGNAERTGTMTGALAALVHPYVGGAGAPTGPVTRATVQWLETASQWSTLQVVSEALVSAFLDALAAPASEARRAQLFDAVRLHRELLAKGPHAPRNLLAGLAQLPGCDQTWSFKTTGAGGEDALLLLGPRAALTAADAWLRERNWRPLDAGYTERGAHLVSEDRHA